MSKYRESCAFTRACGMPGPRYILRGTKLAYCGMHIRYFDPVVLESITGQGDSRQAASDSGNILRRIAGTRFAKPTILEVAERETTAVPRQSPAACARR